MLATTNAGSYPNVKRKSLYQKFGSVILLLVTSFLLFGFSSQEAEARIFTYYYEGPDGCPYAITWESETWEVLSNVLLSGPCSETMNSPNPLETDFPLYYDEELLNEIHDGDEALEGTSLEELRNIIRDYWTSLE